MDLRKGFDPAVEALELKAGIVLQNPGLESLGLHRSFEQRDPLVQIVDGVGTTALLADAELDVTGACFGKSSPVGPGRGRFSLGCSCQLGM